MPNYDIQHLFPARFEVLTTVLLKILAFWDVSLCRASSSQCPEGNLCLHIEVQAACWPLVCRTSLLVLRLWC